MAAEAALFALLEEADKEKDCARPLVPLLWPKGECPGGDPINCMLPLPAAEVPLCCCCEGYPYARAEGKNGVPAEADEPEG